MLVLIGPGPGLLTLVWLVASWAIIVGALRIALGFRLHSLQEHGIPLAVPPAAPTSPARPV